MNQPDRIISKIDPLTLTRDEAVEMLLGEGKSPGEADAIAESWERLKGMHNDYVDDTDPVLI